MSKNLKFKQQEEIWTEMKLQNFYGHLNLLKLEGRYYLALDDHNSTSAIEIDENLYKNLMEFKNVDPIYL